MIFLTVVPGIMCAVLSGNEVLLNMTLTLASLLAEKVYRLNSSLVSYVIGCFLY